MSSQSGKQASHVQLESNWQLTREGIDLSYPTSSPRLPRLHECHFIGTSFKWKSITVRTNALFKKGNGRNTNVNSVK